MTITSTPLENVCKFLLQKNLTFEIRNKTFKKGRLILFHQKNFYLVFLLEKIGDPNNPEKVEIPIPFSFELHEADNLLFFDYRIKTITKDTPIVEPLLKMYSQSSTGHRFLDTILTINASGK